MKSTKVFQKNILKSRLFKNGEEGTKSVPEPNDEMRDLIFKKKKLREVFNKEIQNIIVKEFRNYFDGKKINKKIIHLTKHIPKKLNKSNIERVIEDFILPKAQ